MLREVQRLSQAEGINLAGVKRILALEDQVAALRARVAELQADLEAAAAAMARREQEVHASYRRDLVQVSRRDVLPWRPPSH
jgi:MerR family transcriptional regulator/heat shock protein HspR